MANINVDASYVEQHGDEELVIDLRPSSLYEGGHIPGAKNVDYRSLKAEFGSGMPVKLAERLESLGASKDEPVILYCQIGMTSAAAEALLEAQGFSEIRHYAGGWEDWSSECFRTIEE